MGYLLYIRELGGIDVFFVLGIYERIVDGW